MFWYENDLKWLENNIKQLTTQPETIFYGSSSIRQWSSLDATFADLKPVNLGFGGSTLAACVWFFDRIMKNFQPKRMIIYAGDNDLGDGRHPEEVFIFFRQLTIEISKHFPDIPCYYISLKPSIARWHIVNQFHYTNKLIADEISANLPKWTYIDVYNKMLDANGQLRKDLFLHDGLHLSDKGYSLWNDTVKQELQTK